MGDDAALAFWRTAATVAVDRRAALDELRRIFAAGSVPNALRGFHAGRLVATTLGGGLDLLPEMLARLWMPWRGKTFGAREGANVFARSARPLIRLAGPTAPRALGPAQVAAFGFRTSTAPSALVPGTRVLRIDYDHAANPRPVRIVLDELVTVADGLFLGQALFRRAGRARRMAWFALESPPTT